MLVEDVKLDQYQYVNTRFKIIADLWLCGPTYNDEGEEKYYSKKLLNKSKMLRQMIRVVKVGGFVGILDQTMPQGPPHNVKCVARIGVTSVPNLDMRILTVFRKESK